VPRAVSLVVHEGHLLELQVVVGAEHAELGRVIRRAVRRHLELGDQDLPSPRRSMTVSFQKDRLRALGVAVGTWRASLSRWELHGNIAVGEQVQRQHPPGACLVHKILGRARGSRGLGVGRGVTFVFRCSGSTTPNVGRPLSNHSG
jgi:hypothetical protein